MNKRILLLIVGGAAFLLALVLSLLLTASKARAQGLRNGGLYLTEEVTFTNTEDGATLAGTLTVPVASPRGGMGTSAKVPVLLMVTGSGQQNRDEELMGHKPFAVIADYLGRCGIATLRYDDRGFGQSHGGEVQKATTEDFARDAEAGIRFLRSTGRFGQVGILGHSEGGTIAFMLGGRQLVDFVVSLAGPAVSGDSIVWKQLQSLAPEQAAMVDVQAVREQQLASGIPWLAFFATYDPSANIRNTTCPVLALNGTKDVQVDAAMNLSALRRLLPANSLSVIREYDGLNHLFQHCQTGLPDEYGHLAETFAEEVLHDMAEWISGI